MKSFVTRQRLIEIDGMRGYTLEAGEGPTVVIIASMLVLARSYLRPIKHFSGGFRVIVVESPGSGRGTRLSRPWSFDEYARWIERLLEKLDLRDVTLVGHSTSAAVALRLADGRARHVRRVVLADSIGASESRSLLRILIRRAVDCWFEPILTLRAWHHVLINAVFHPINFFNQVLLSGRTDLTEVASRAKLPVLLAWGQWDHTTPPRDIPRLRERMTSADVSVHLQPRASHDWLITHADRFARVLKRWIAKTSSSA
jgi:pimeloyl-ACP methyl ester carboxylesterase